MDILVTGGTGQVGIELLRHDWPEGVTVHAPPRAELDLLDPASIRRVLGSRKWAAIINSGAYTAVDRAESDAETAWRVNAFAPAVLAHGAAGVGIPIVQVSTDYVFDGTKDGYYTEEDPVAPISVYGRSKEAGEQAVRMATARHAIVRTAWVVSAHGSNFVKTMLRLARERTEISVVSDQRGCPTFAAELAAVLAQVTLTLTDRPHACGTYHFVSGSEANWSDFARAIFAASSQRGGPSALVRDILTTEYPTPAKRPANSRLSTERIKSQFGIASRAWQDGLTGLLSELDRGSEGTARPT